MKEILIHTYKVSRLSRQWKLFNEDKFFCIYQLNYCQFKTLINTQASGQKHQNRTDNLSAVKAAVKNIVFYPPAFQNSSSSLSATDFQCRPFVKNQNTAERRIVSTPQLDWSFEIRCTLWVEGWKNTVNIYIFEWIQEDIAIIHSQEVEAL